MAELTVLSIKPGTPTFLQWHYNHPRESWDLHAITPAKSTDWPPRVTLSAVFGGGKKHVYAELERLDDELVDRLNQRRSPQKQITSAKKRRKEKAAAIIKKGKPKSPSLAELIAAKTKGKALTSANLVTAIQETKVTVTKLTKKFVSVLWPGRKQPRRYALDLLLEQVITHQKELSHQKNWPEMDMP